MSVIASATSSSDASLPLLHIDGPRATIRLNRPAHLNRLHPEDIAALMQHFARIDADAAIRVVVLTGSGRAFGAGYHLGVLAETRRELEQSTTSPDLSGAVYEDTPFERMCNALEDLRPLTICRINGGVYGGATDLALCCDFRIGVDTCDMFMPAARLGLHYYRRGLLRYVSRLGLNAAKRLFLTGQTLSADEMLRIGYLDEIVPEAELDGAVDRLAEALLSQAPMAVQGMKQTLNDIARQAYDAEKANARHLQTLHSDDLREGVTAWHEKRKPVFRGR